MRESAIEKRLRKQVNKYGGTCYKWVSPGHRGVPDRIVIFPGAVFFVELKQKRGVVSALQKACAKRLGDLGFDVVVLRSVEQVDTWVQLQASVLAKLNEYGRDA